MNIHADTLKVLSKERNKVYFKNNFKNCMVVIGAASIFYCANVNSQIDMEASCRGNIRLTTEWAEWGVGLRTQLIQTCKKQDINVCMKKYLDDINTQYQKNLTALLAHFNTAAYSQSQRVMMTAHLKFGEVAAITALKTGKDPSTIANDIYTNCISVR